MKKIITLTFISLLLIAVSCKRSEQKEQETERNSQTVSVSSKEEMHDMSIFLLPSEWETQEGKKIQLKDLQGNVLVMVMIYTSCTSACPILVADMKKIEERVGGNTSTPVKYVLITIDPVNDTAEVLKNFAAVRKMDGKQWLFLRSSDENTREFANVLAVKYTRISPIDFSHSNIISVFDENGVLQYQQEGLDVDNKDITEKITELANHKKA